MIRWLAGIFLLIVVSVVCVYVFIPSQLHILKSVRVRSNANATARFLSNERNWAGAEANPAYRLGRRLSQAVEVLIPNGGGQPLSSWASSIPTNVVDSAEIQWQLSVETGLNPFERIGRYRAAGQIGKEMEGMLSRFRDSVRDSRIYGFEILQVNGGDSCLLVKRTEVSAEPSTGELYGLFGELRAYGGRAGVVRTGSPMTNLTPLAGGRYSLETALPIDRVVPSGKGIFFRHMVPIQFLMTEVRGGPGRIRDGFAQLQDYMMDHQRTVMAMPFQSLITDRSQEPDTSRWVTRIYYPVYPFN